MGTMSTMGAAAIAASGYGKTGGDLLMGFAAAAACAGTFSEKIPDREKIQRAQQQDQQTVNNIFHKKPSPSGI